MLRGGRSRAPAKPRRPHHPRQRTPSPPTPSRTATGAAAGAAAGAGSKDLPALEAPVVSSVEETSFTFEFKRGFKRAKKAMLPPVDARTGDDDSRGGSNSREPSVVSAQKEAPKQVEFTHCSPGIVARLMGLDTVPRPKKILDRCQSDTRANLQRHLSGVVRGAVHASSVDQPCDVSSGELPALKDVFEVTEMESMAMHELFQPGEEKTHLSNIEADLEFVRQKFLDAKRLATDEGHTNSREFSEALEILHSKRDVFLEILQENRTAVSGFSGYILSHSGLQCPHTSNTATVQSFEQEILCNMEGVCDGNGMHDIAQDSEKLIPSMLLKGTSDTPVEPPAPKGGRSKGSNRRSQIVVLKPNLQRKNFTPVLSSREASQYKKMSGTPHSKPPHHNKQYSVPQKKEILEEGGMEIQKVRKQTPKSGSRRRPSKEENNLEADTGKAKVASTSHDYTMPICSSIHSAEPSGTRKTRKHLSERWQITCQPGSEHSIPKGIKTLGEMLGLSDRDAPKETSCKGSSDPNFSPYNAREVPGSPLGISSKDGWKTGIYTEDDSRGGISRNFPRSKSLPASSTTSVKLSGRRQSVPARGLPILKDILSAPADESENAHIRKRSPIRNAKQKNGKASVRLGKENMLPEKEIHVTSEKARHSFCISDLSRASNTHTETYPDDAIRTQDQDKSTVQHDDTKNYQGHMGQICQALATAFPEIKEDLSIQNHDSITLKEGRNPSVEIDVSQVDTRAAESPSIASAESCACSSPTPSSQQSSVEETSYSGIFKSINVDIQELRAQLKMLKMEGQDDICGDYSGTLSSEENNMNVSIYQDMEEQLSMFKDEEDRDFSYVQDMLASLYDLPDHAEDWQVSSDVFLCLENKYNKLVLWSKSDRKLLFDLVNSVLADMTTPDNSLISKLMMKCWPEIDCGQLAENVWQMVLKRSNYEHFVLEDVQPLPLDHSSELELVGMKIARMIHDDIIKDCIVEFMLQDNLATTEV